MVACHEWFLFFSLNYADHVCRLCHPNKSLTPPWTYTFRNVRCARYLLVEYFYKVRSMLMIITASNNYIIDTCRSTLAKLVKLTRWIGKDLTDSQRSMLTAKIKLILCQCLLPKALSFPRQLAVVQELLSCQDWQTFDCHPTLWITCLDARVDEWISWLAFSPVLESAHTRVFPFVEPSQWELPIQNG